MTQLTSVPDGVFLVRENDVRHALQLRAEGKVLLDGQRLPPDGNSGDKIGRMDDAKFLGLLPVETIAEPLSWKRLRKTKEVGIPAIGLTIGVTAFAAHAIFISQGF